MNPQPKKVRTYAAIHDILFHEWDPIGCGVPPDEYDSYIPKVYSLLALREPPEKMFEYLWRLETIDMEMPGDRDKTQRVAERLLRLPAEIAAAE